VHVCLTAGEHVFVVAVQNGHFVPIIAADSSAPYQGHSAAVSGDGGDLSHNAKGGRIELHPLLKPVDVAR
jgi:hypothetical protein